MPLPAVLGSCVVTGWQESMCCAALVWMDGEAMDFACQFCSSVSDVDLGGTLIKQFAPRPVWT